ncbi:MAG: nucleoside triphosphate hydrolase, partial [Gammaproteobacteria bacterium]
MHRNELLALLNEYATPVITEAGYVAQAKQFVAVHEDCFHSDLYPGHVTGSAWVVNPSREKVL